MSTSHFQIQGSSPRSYEVVGQPAAHRSCEAALIAAIDRAALTGAGSALIVYRADIKSSASWFETSGKGRSLFEALRRVITDVCGEEALVGQTACGALAIGLPGASLEAAVRAAETVADLIVQDGLLTPFQDALHGLDWFITESRPQEDARAFVHETLLDAVGMS